jgi:hypothetical protein
MKITTVKIRTIKVRRGALRPVPKWCGALVLYSMSAFAAR